MSDTVEQIVEFYTIDELEEHADFDTVLLAMMLDDAVGYELHDLLDYDILKSEILSNRTIFGLVVDEELVALSVIYKTKYGISIDIFVMPSKRNKGYGTAIALRVNYVCQIDIWATSMDNIPSIKIAHKLGLTKPVSHGSDYAIRLTR